MFFRNFSKKLRFFVAAAVIRGKVTIATAFAQMPLFLALCRVLGHYNINTYP